MPSKNFKNVAKEANSNLPSKAEVKTANKARTAMKRILAETEQRIASGEFEGEKGCGF